MPQPKSFVPSPTPPTGHRRCPVCAQLMFLALLEPTYQQGYDVRTFECPCCAYSEIALTAFE